MLSDASLHLIDLRARRLSLKHGVPISSVSKGIGAVPYGPLSQAEYLLHEVGHWLTLGHTIKELPSKLHARITPVLDRISSDSCNSLEIDAAFVTFHAGYALDFWDDPEAIAKCANRNLQSLSSLNFGAEPVLREFERRKSRKGLLRMSGELALWFRPSAKKLLRTFSGRFLVEDPQVESLSKVAPT